MIFDKIIRHTSQTIGRLSSLLVYAEYSFPIDTCETDLYTESYSRLTDFRDKKIYSFEGFLGVMQSNAIMWEYPIMFMEKVRLLQWTIEFLDKI